MKFVIQCAAGKQTHAGTMRDAAGRKVAFVAHPELVPVETDEWEYARPDDRTTENGRTWRQLVVEYNRESGGGNPLGLLRAYRLYTNPAYQRLVEYVGIDDVFILSAGWGLLRSDFLTPAYDITFTQSADPWKRRKTHDDYADFRMLSPNGDEAVVFLGGKDYLPLFARLTDTWLGPRVAVYNSQVVPTLPGIRFVRFPTTARTNWHYQAVTELVSGRYSPFESEHVADAARRT